MGDVKAIPDGYPQVIPHLCVDGADAAIAFYGEVFGARERMRMGGAPGDPPEKVGHAELEIGDALVMLSDEYPEMNAVSPKTVGGTPVTVMVYVEDVDATVARAVALGATVVRPIEDQFYGDRSGRFEDPWGHDWYVATHVEDVSPEEMERRAAEMAGG
jgi:PhnB protein